MKALIPYYTIFPSVKLACMQTDREIKERNIIRKHNKRINLSETVSNFRREP